MQFRDMEFTDTKMDTCNICTRDLGNIFDLALSRSEADLIGALEEFIEYKNYGVYVKDATLKIVCPTCLTRSKGQVPMEDVMHKLSTTQPKEATSEDD